MGKKTLCDSYLKYKNTVEPRAGLVKQGFPWGPHIWGGNIANKASLPRSMLGRSGNSLRELSLRPWGKENKWSTFSKTRNMLERVGHGRGSGPWRSVSSVPENHTLPSTVDSSYESVPRPLWAWWVKFLGYPVFPLCSSTVWLPSFCVCATLYDCFYCLHRRSPHFLPFSSWKDYTRCSSS